MEEIEGMEVLKSHLGLTSNSSSANSTAEEVENNDLSDKSVSNVIEEDLEDELSGVDFNVDFAVNGVEDIWKINLRNMSIKDAMKYHFPNVEVAFMFYNWYAGLRGFAARKNKILRNKNGEATQQTFLCYRQGYREEKVGSSSRKREPKAQTRCGYEANCRVHIEITIGRWYIKYLNDCHNHTLVDEKYLGMLPAHRKITDYDKFQMDNMRKVGIRTTHVFGLFAHQAGGYDKVGFRQRDMYNEVAKDKRSDLSDAGAALEFLATMSCSDEMLFWRHSIDENGRLQHLFWCDGVCRKDYEVFGDVLAFDATYRKNMYLCPLVVFFGVNHHNQSIVFASAIVGNEKEETYVWLLEMLVEAMGGKTPKSVITDGDKAMRNAIKRVLPNSHHRLCAWHLLRNAATNISNTRFIPKFKQCMLGDYEIDEFEQKWENLISEFSLQENIWVLDMYAKRNMWAAAHVRGNFFAGFRTTSRCEGLHSFLGRYVNYENNLL
ncbi:protein FAR1-RELATED SEQUENCE 5-like [Vicia villosa]|uniref:protein FAR1-RELATED SEQUENCE 5-like n=1 Tax=Vicia villosa TaxID=3911 RepID=UPI00273B7C66|nr:protein FAR1-RELATED SEQUENCE 5-like [Vicia villosa]